MTPTLKAYSYIRFSTPDQLKGDSLRRQTEAAESWAKDHGLALDNTLKLQDLGLSAFDGNHRDKGALGAFLKLVEGGQIPEGSVLLVESLDRLSREEITEALEQFLAIIRSGIKIVTLSDNNREYTKETINANVGDLIVSLTIMSRAHEESKMKSIRMKAARAGERDQARNGGAKHGSKCPGWLRPIRDETEIVSATTRQRPKILEYEKIPERAAVIERIFEMKLVDGWGSNRIASELNKTPNIWKPNRKDPRRKGDGWRGSYVRKILTNPETYGEFQQYKIISVNGDKKKKVRVAEGEPIPNYYPAVILEKTFFHVQALFKQNQGTGGETGMARNIFQGLLRCGYCKGAVHYIDKGAPPKGGTYLVCDRTRRAVEGSCGCKSGVRYDEFQELVLDYCKGLGGEQIEELLGEVDHRQKSELLIVQTDLSAKRAKLDDVALRIKNLLDQSETAKTPENRMLLDERLDKRRMEMDSLKEEIDKLERKCTELSSKSESFRSSVDSVQSLHRLLSKANQPDAKARDIRLRLRQTLKGLIEKVVVYPEGWPRYSPEVAQRALDDLSILFPKGTDEHGWLRDYLRLRLEYPKGYRFYSICFVGGSIRMLRPCFPQRQLAAEWDAEKQETWAWEAKVPDEELQKRMKHFDTSLQMWEVIYDNGAGEKVLDEMRARHLERVREAKQELQDFKSNIETYRRAYAAGDKKTMDEMMAEHLAVIKAHE